MISKEHLALLACPACQGDLTQTDSGNSLHCHSCSLSYQVKAGIPVMMPDETLNIRGQAARGGVC